MSSLNYPVVTKQTLQRNTLEVCEFCEEAFTNRYDSVIHNASHIIIPLLKQDFEKCSKCSYWCTSQRELHQHIIIKHPVIIKTEKLNLWDLEERNYITNGNDMGHDDVDDIYVKTTSSHSSVGLQNGENVSETSSDVIVENKDDSCLEDDIVISETVNNATSTRTSSFKDRFMFESDDYNILSDSDCSQEQEPLKGTPKKSVSFDLNVSNSGPDADIDTPLICHTNPEEESEPNESHYHSLIRPIPLFCRYCSAMFLTRYSLIIHEQKHIKFKQKIMGMLCLHCDKYIAGDYTNLSKHIDAKHSKDKYKVYCTRLCTKCGLQYRSYKHHIHNYHFTKCCKINKFVTDNNFKNHLDKCLCHTHVLSVCRQCYIVIKEDDNFKCITLGIRHMKGVFQVCKKCDTKVNEIISVKLSCKIQSKYQCWYVEDKPLSNKDRLKNIRMRLKKLNILSKMYCFVSICDAKNSLLLIYILSFIYKYISIIHKCLVYYNTPSNMMQSHTLDYYNIKLLLVTVVH